MNGACLEFEDQITDAVSRIRFAPLSNNLLISSWDSKLRLYDVDRSLLRFEVASEAALLDCCFQSESVALSVGSDGFVTRYDLHSTNGDTIGNHEDIATRVGYSEETCQIITAGLDKKIICWDTRTTRPLACLEKLDAEVESMSLSGFILMVAIGASVYMYDLRNLDKLVQSKESKADVRIRCVSSHHSSRGYAVGSIDGRVTLEIDPTVSNDMGYTFRCYPKSRDGKFLVPVNDIVFNPHIGSAFVTGDNEGYVMAWDARSKRKLCELPRYPNSVASLSYNREGQILAIASSYTYQEANEKEEPPQIFLHNLDDNSIRSCAGGSSSRK
ncbi:mitotic checkpoint protein BUB3.3 [Tripterygium wilfordii]|uniref:Mitotic checkpoint protein BUB3.3 n=1 Tax=Tripterygium wilfordii TaxID=458696 RepID=A0A7J7C070_TRIWF|nr:mitotic checkpoint protein BUB3.3 [Tripterygium wilfordii]KAF5727166.1 mitotic checkpoint protein BUB3.3 [Tripterygium wilfordii]